MSTPRQEAPKGRRRLPPEERRRQLVAIGLQELSTRPIHALSIDRVAEIAGISRGLLFRYFPTKQDFYVAVVGAASRRLLRAADPDPDEQDPLRAVLQPFVSFIDRHGDNYQAFFHSGVGSDPQIRDIHDSMRDTMVERVVAALGCDDTPVTRMRLRAWWALVESLAIDRFHEGTPSIDEIVDYSAALLPTVLTGP
ncbi:MULTISPECIES: TetR/AcrR family transcriptional regulator [Rhodococcus]|uniref:TetR/AcrR family transcriptional regulator n=1 Tax=Rhodococcus rhodochrous TaxID=1829 RepID=A0AA46WXA4_RHORH|nr:MULTISPECIES: TetR/AcrR family transcriptional regulator [Rhodococcus]AYA24470.1 TetR/AcrR family transcriptional regulator [Rhodococcus rhodochrous]MCD2099725.1 TetR/AcrR family transcriptional regulator [Rhodococcus rhodochrous]MCD2124143.1 TetR/AcrR family transcriptional regulator [Rhodococcus rhodochrous]MCQ4136965.1 TetR/AcrR family transcriptional regulator [Rhodococcus rhodochrous]MDJ0020917.1 TetR/AcrR family transcriptional regulator [Rhodococcus rhodochrous]